MAKQRAVYGGKLVNPSDYLASIELSGDLTLTISGVGHEKLWREGIKEPETKFVLSFKETPKRFILSARTNEDTICRLHGNQAEEWIGKQVTLFPTTCRVGRETEPCIRIRATAPKADSIGEKNAAKIKDKLAAKNSDVSELMAHVEPVPNTADIAEWPRSLVPQIQAFLAAEPAE